MTSSANSTDDSTGALPAWLKPWLSWRRKRFWALALLIAYTLGGFFLVPRLVESQLTKTFAPVDRSATVSEIRSNPFLLTLEVKGFELKDTDETSLLSVERFFADVQTSSIFRLALTFKNLTISSPKLFDERYAGTDTRWVRLLADLTPPAEAEVEAEASDLPPLILQQLFVEDARVSVVDRPEEGYRADMGPLTVRLADVRTRPDHVGSQNVELLINETDRIAWQGDLQLVPFRSVGQVEFAAFSLQETRELLDYFLPFDIDFEELDAKFAYEIAIKEDGLAATLDGLSGRLTGFEAVMDEGGPAMVTLRELSFAGGTAVLPARWASLESLELQGLTVRVALQADGELDLLDMLPEPQPGATAKGTSDLAQAASEAPWRIELGRFALEDGRISMEDRTVTPLLAAELEQISVEAQQIDNQDGTRVPVELSAQLASGGQLGFSGEVMAFPAPELAGQGRLDQLATRLAQPYLNDYLNAELTGGLLTLEAELRHGPEQLLSAEGSMNFTEFSINDRLRDELLASWNTLEIDRFELDLKAETLATSELKFDGLYGRLAIAEDRSTNVGDLIVAAPDAEAAQPSADSAGPAAQADLPLAVTLGGILMSDTSLDFSDSSLPLPFSAAIRELNGEISTLSTSSSEPAEIGLEGRVNEFGLARINGAILPMDPMQQADLGMVFRNLDIARLTPYTIQFAGYAIEEGRLDLDLGYRLEARRMIGENSVIVRDIELGEKSDLPGAGNLPLGLAIALLKNSEGVIDLDVPVEGDLDNPEFRIGGVVMQALGNLITRAVTAPFRLLGSLVGVDSEDFGTLSFQPGRADLSPPDEEQLLKLAEAMLQRPELAVEVAGTWIESLDRTALQEASVAEALEAWLTENPGGDELTTGRDLRALESLTLAANPAADLDALKIPFQRTPADDPEADPVLDELAYMASLRSALEDSVVVSEAQLQALGRARGEAVIRGLQAGLPEGAQSVVAAEPVALEAGEDSAVTLELAVTVED